MDKISSSSFRRIYAYLTAPTIVTVNGHPIGKWVPVVTHPEPVTFADQFNVPTTGDTPPGYVEAAMREVARTFTPVPKPSQRK